LGEVRAENADVVANANRDHPDIHEYDELFLGDRRTIAQYEADEKSLYEFLWESSLPPEFPIIVENGEMEFDITATQEQFEAFGEALDETGRQYDLLTLIHTDEQETVLTDRQRGCLTVAQRRGYFAVPRECTLADLANVLDVDKSTPAKRSDEELLVSSNSSSSIETDGQFRARKKTISSVTKKSLQIAVRDW
jgi:predicted DNA binding protein